MPVQKVYYSIPATNDAQTQIDSNNKLSSGFSFTKGNANIRFSIAAQDRLLDTSDMYLTGQVIHMDSSADPIQISAATTRAQFNASNGTDMRAYTNLNLGNWAGLETAIKRIFVQSKKSSVEISQNNNYPMYKSVRNGYQNNDQDYLVSPLIREDAPGKWAKDLGRHATIMPVGDHASCADFANLDNINDPNYGKPFSFKLDTALLNNVQPIHLGNNFMGGVVINIELNNSDGVYHERWAREGANLVNVAGSYYLIKNLRLTGRFSVPTPQDLQSYQPQLMLNDRVNLINDVVSSTNSSKYTPNLGMVRSFVNLFLDQDQQNNLKKNQTIFREPCGLREYQQNKNSTRQPEDFVVKVSPNLLTKTVANGAASVSAADVGDKVLMLGDAEVRNRFQRAVLNGDLAGKTSASLELTNDELGAQYDTGGGAATGEGDNTQADLLGIGLDYTHHFGNSTNFVNQDYDLIMRSGVQSGDTVLPASRRSQPEVQETYVKNVAVLNSQTLVKSVQ